MSQSGESPQKMNMGLALWFLGYGHMKEPTSAQLLLSVCACLSKEKQFIDERVALSNC